MPVTRVGLSCTAAQSICRGAGSSPRAQVSDPDPRPDLHFAAMPKRLRRHRVQSLWRFGGCLLPRRRTVPCRVADAYDIGAERLDKRRPHGDDEAAARRCGVGAGVCQPNLAALGRSPRRNHGGAVAVLRIQVSPMGRWLDSGRSHGLELTAWGRQGHPWGIWRSRATTRANRRASFRREYQYRTR